MNDNTTIIVITRNNYKQISITIKKLNDYMKKYRNIQQTIIIDNNSDDGTNLLLKEPSPNNFLFILSNKKHSEKTLILKALDLAQTPNIILIEPELYTRLHQIQRQIKKLRKTHLLLPNRFNKKSRVKFKNKQEEFRIKSKNYMINLLTNIGIEDVINKNKAFKKDVLTKIIKKTKTKEMFWIETVKTCQKKGIKITQCKTHHIQEEKPRKDNLIIFFKLIKELILIKKKK
jgi:hypothetical protein